MNVNLETERLLLRPFVQADAKDVLRAYGDPVVYKHMGVSYHSLEEVQTQINWYNDNIAKETGRHWAFCDKLSGVMVGGGGYHLWNHEHKNAEIGYWLFPDSQGQGLATEGLRTMIDFGFKTMGLHRIEAVVELENNTSSALLKRVGFTLESIKRDCEWKNGTFISLQIWSLLAFEWE